MEDEYKTIASPSEGIYKEKGSRFISLAYPIRTDQEAIQLIQHNKQKFHDARHLCYAYVLGQDKNVYRINDDGEPSGTAGNPIYGQILSNDLTNILIIVIRYFGGTKLGKPGLINAYRESARDAIVHAKIILETINKNYSVSFDYALLNWVLKIIRKHQGNTTFKSIQQQCEINFSIRKNHAEKIILNLKTNKNLIIKDL